VCVSGVEGIRYRYYSQHDYGQLEYSTVENTAGK